VTTSAAPGRAADLGPERAKRAVPVLVPGNRATTALPAALHTQEPAGELHSES